MAGIFNNGIWSCGLDFLPTGTPTVGGVFDFIAGNPLVGPTFARSGIGKGVSCPDTPTALTRSLGTTLVTTIVGFAYSPSILPATLPNAFSTFYDLAGTPQMNLCLNPNGSIQFYQNGGLTNTGGGSVSTPIGSASTTGLIVPLSYNFIEIQYTNLSSGGILLVRMNNNQVVSFAGNTSKGGSVNAFILGSKQNGVNNSFDDIYILDGTGVSPNNTFLGNGRLQNDVPTADSATAGLNQWAFTTPAGSDFANAANIPAVPAQFNTGSAVGQRMMFRFPTTTALKSNFINTWISAEEDVAGPCGLTPVFRNGGVDQPTAEVSQGTSFVYFNKNSVINPATGLPWYSGTGAQAAAAEIGVTRTT